MIILSHTEQTKALAAKCALALIDAGFKVDTIDGGDLDGHKLAVTSTSPLDDSDLALQIVMQIVRRNDGGDLR